MPPSRGMAVGKEDISLESREIKIGSWIPSTPAKTHFINQQLICRNGQENYLVGENKLQTKRSPRSNHARRPNRSESVRILGTLMVPACYDCENPMTVSRVDNTWQERETANAHVHRENSRTRQVGAAPNVDADDNTHFNCWQQGDTADSNAYGEDLCNSSQFPIKDADKWTMSFGNLLALAHAGGTTTSVSAVKQSDFIAISTSSPAHFHPQIEDIQLKTSCQNLSMEDVDSLFPTEFETELNRIPDVLKSGTSTPARIFFDLNSSPAIIKSASLIDSMPYKFDPTTPEKINKAEDNQLESATSDLNAEEEVPSEQNVQGVKIVDEVKGFHKKDEQSKFVTDQLRAPISTRLQENHKPDKGGNETIELIKTPQQKPITRKHRPKVIREGQPKSTPKRKSDQRKNDNPIKTTLKAQSSGTHSSNVVSSSIRKRKYEGRKEIDKFEPKLKKVTVKTRSLKSIRHIRSSCRRSLNFDLECPVKEERFPGCQSLSCDMELKAVKLNAEDKPRATMLLRRGMEVFCNVSHDNEASTEQEESSPDDRWTPKSPSDSDHSSTYLIQEKQVVGLKRQEKDSNGTGGMYFPEIYKKKRTVKGRNRANFNLKFATASDIHMELEKQPLVDSCTKLFTSRTNQGSFVSQYRPTYMLNYKPARDTIGNKHKNFQGLLALGSTEWIKKKRSKGFIRMRNLASLMEICKELPASSNKRAQGSRINHKTKILEKQGSCMGALVADIRPTMTTKKRSKRGMISNETVKHLYDHHQFSCKSKGPLLGITWKHTSPIDLHEENKALVPYERAGAVVPYSLLDHIRRQPRPKVDLDDETTRVWKLLLENINSEGIDGTDEGKRKRWEEERTVFNGRADSFIARMRLIQGDRRFSPWKGSVVDSVVGVFLTQNVSDHLSSSAFMTLAAYFPFESKANVAELHDGRIGTKVNEPEVCVLDHEDPFKLDKELYNRPGVNPKMFQDFDCNDIRMANIDEPSENKFDGITSKVDSRCLLSEISIHDPVISDDTVSIKSNSFIHDQRDMDDTLSSQTSVISSHNVTNSPILLTDKGTDTHLLSTSEEEPTAESKRSRFSLSTSFVKLLQMAGTVLHGASETSSDNMMGKVPEHGMFQENTYEIQSASNITACPQNPMNATGRSINLGHSKMFKQQGFNPSMNDPDYHPNKQIKRKEQKAGRIRKDKQRRIDWDRLRNQTQATGEIRERTANKLDTVDWDAVRCADANEIAQIIKERGMNNMLAQRIKDFLNRLVNDHGSTDLEWLRDVPPDKAKEYLLSIRGLGLKSVECVRLLTLHQLAFPVDTNVGRIAVRLGWVPLQPLPESLQLHLLELYPVLESIQKYLWPRLCKLDQRTLYELHYQMITFGKVFCTKNKPNCNACPMRGECRHFASAFASARLALPVPDERSIVSTTERNTADQKSWKSMNILSLPSPEGDKTDAKLVSNFQPIIEEPTTPEPIIEVPLTPDPGYTQVLEYDIENSFCDDSDEIPTIQLNMEEFTHNLQKIMQENSELVEKDMSKALVALNPEAASIPVPKLKNVSRLRTEHQVYELPDSHLLLEGMDKREPDDPSPYLLAIWTPGETLNSTEPPERRCNSQVSKKLCSDKTCLSCNSTRESDSQIVRGTLLIPCRTAMRGSFPLNGTYFQVNEVFSDHESSLNPMNIPREWLWNMPRRTVYFGTSIPTIFKGLSTEAIQYCFWRGFVCVRGFDRRTRAPRPLIARLHFPASKLVRGKGKTDENET